MDLFRMLGCTIGQDCLFGQLGTSAELNGFVPEGIYTLR